MPSPTPTGPIAVAVDAVRTLVSNLPFFQTWTGAANAAAALNSIFPGEVGWKIVSVTIAGGVMAIATDNAHTILSGQTVTLEGASIGPESNLPIAGAQVVTAVGSAAFSCATALAAGGPFYPDFAFVLPCARPICVVAESAGGDAVRGNSVGTGGASVLSGAIEILIEADVTGTYMNDPTGAAVEMRNSAGTFLQQLIQYQGTGDFIVLNDCEMGSMEFTDQMGQDTAGRRYERWRATIKATWGLTG